MNHIERKPGIVRLTRRLENAVSLDRPVGALEPTITSVFGSGRRGWLLRGVNGSATLFTRCSPMSRSAPGLPPAFLIFSVAPKILCGPNTYRQRPARRGTNGLDRMGRVGNRGTTRQAGRPCPRRYQWPLDRYLRNLVGGPPPGRHSMGAKLALGAALVSALGAYLGGHLTDARNVATHHPAYGPSAGVSSQ